MLALVEVPGWQAGPREDLQTRLAQETLKDAKGTPCQTFERPLPDPICTHYLHEPGSDRVTGALHAYGINNHPSSRVKVIFVPCYLDGRDGIFNLHYYDMLLGLDLTVYPSYYEPWGYTPLESIAFRVPCLTTTLAGFGLWAEETKAAHLALKGTKSAKATKTAVGTEATVATDNHCHLDTDGVEVIARSDYNFDEVSARIADEIRGFAALDSKSVDAARKAAHALAQEAQWKHFIHYYYKAYDIALGRAAARMEER